MSKITWGIVALIVIIIGIYIAMSGGDTEEMSNENSTTGNQTGQNGQNNNVDSARGRVVFSVTDAAANMANVNELNMKVNRVDVHSDASGWVTVSSTPRTYSLLALKASGKSELLADVQVNATNYDAVRIIIDSVSVKTDAATPKITRLPSQELIINTMLVVADGKTSSVNFDFLADKSLHSISGTTTSASGEYVFAPVVKVESRSDATLSMDAKSVVKIDSTKGHVDGSKTFGMDLDGSVKENFQLDGAKKIELNSDNTIKLNL